MKTGIERVEDAAPLGDGERVADALGIKAGNSVFLVCSALDARL
jgi:hypothetical protein